MTSEGPHPGAAPTPCLDENLALAFVQGDLDPDHVSEVEAHIDACPGCGLLVEEATRAFRSRSTAERAARSRARIRFAAGDELAGRYRIERFLARGGMGEVYEAVDTMLGDHVALKTLAADLSDDPLAVRRLKREVHLARRITHPHVCRIFDLGVHQQPPGASGGPGAAVHFLTMELVPGPSLGSRLRREGPLSLPECLRIVEMMAAALTSAHEAGIIHRDFKSDNVLLAPPPGPGQPTRVVVTDFGLAQLSPGHAAARGSSVGGQSLAGALAGTLPYMAPEQLRGDVCLPHTDIYALGVVLFEMVTGRLPWNGEQALEVASRRLVEEPPSPRALIPDLPARWEAAILRCLARAPEARFASARDVVAALRSEAGAAELPAGVPKARTRTGRRLAVALVVGLALAGGVALSRRGGSAGGEPAARGASPTLRAPATPPAAAPPALARISAPIVLGDAGVTERPRSRRSPPAARPALAARADPPDAAAPATAPATAASRTPAGGAGDAASPAASTAAQGDASAQPSRWLRDPEEGFIVR